jgi:hypothetical protein
VAGGVGVSNISAHPWPSACAAVSSAAASRTLRPELLVVDATLTRSMVAEPRQIHIGVAPEIAPGRSQGQREAHGNHDADVSSATSAPIGAQL